LLIQGLSKSFPGVKALDDVFIKAEGGRVTALMGENGAGKSTLLKILAGDIEADEGSFSIDGQAQTYKTPLGAISAGVSVIYQERQLMPSLSVMENIFAGKLPKNRLGMIDYSRLRQDTEDIIAKFGLAIDPRASVGSLSIAYQQMVEIMKAYRRDSLVIAFDEPTASLAEAEISILFGLIERLREAGKIILYVSHRMSEIFQTTDDVIVLKDGKNAGAFMTSAVSETELIRAMVGRDIGNTYAGLDRNTELGAELLTVRDLETDKLQRVSFSMRQGEIIGFAGLVGAGRTELARAIFAADGIKGGEIIFGGEPVRFRSPKDAINAGIALCPEDRKEQGLVLSHSITKNISIPVLDKLLKARFLQTAEEEKLADEAVRKYDIRTPSVDKRVVELSGGNQQKVILGRWTNEKMNTKLLILDEPTKGIDVGTKAEIYQRICDFAKAGIGVIFISSELTEVINIADTIYVMRSGKITGKLSRGEATEESVLALAMKADG
jgi:ABC-type sugar transport system ATPase subunit